jgi:uncharacterized membrane protein YbhN (UPF0104 family)
VVRRARLIVGLLVLVATLGYLSRVLDQAVLRSAWRAAVGSPGGLLAALVLYAGAFGLRAAAWRTVLPALGFGQAWAALHVSLLGNHVLPLRLGEALRVTSVMRRTSLPAPSVVASAVALRAADLIAVLALALVAAPRLSASLVGGWVWAVATLLVAGLAVAYWLLLRQRRTGADVRLPGARVALAATLAWVLESAVMWQAARAVGVHLSVTDAIAVTAVTIAAQTVAVTPGGVGSYEAAATAAMVVLGVDPSAALAVALLAHGVKTAYSLLVGGVAVFRPAPSYFGRFRLRQVRPARPAPVAVGADAPVVFFFPAHNEEAAVGGVVRRVPTEVCGRRVVAVVIDDGSDDATPVRAAAAGADVIAMPRNMGLGAAVRRGLAESVARGAAAVVFADADGEYAPEELALLVAPVLAGDADYVVGSRFAGQIEHMRPHRRLGNLVLTALLRVVAGRSITDGQSGYRAFSPAAAAAAEIVHDYNYAQVLTLDLLAKGFSYAEVPISYHFRETGSSFVRLGRYLRRVAPAVHRELNTP